jgi:hypothetical protein
MHTVDISREDIDHFMPHLPVPLAGESLDTWFKRGNRAIVADFIRYAADSATDEFPLPDNPLATDRFRLSIQQDGQELELTVQALGMAITEFANSALDLVDAKTALSFARVALNYKGHGQVCIANTIEHRRALLHPQLRRIE